jgi:predicted nuclease of predicted toxin-antitoxin system
VKFLLDMGLAQSTAAYLRKKGFDAIHLRDEEMQRSEDEDIIEKARTEERIILTHDLDFGRLIALSQSQFPSAITFRLDNMRPTFVNHYLDQVLAQSSSELEAGALVSVNERAIRVRTLPIVKNR